MAARSLQLGRIEMAIVGGASLYKPDTLVVFSLAQSMSSSGSRPFDAEADGLIVGEGFGAAVLKTLPRALADGDRIWGVIRGLGVSSDGRGKSLWAPRKEGQIKAIRRAYASGLEMRRLGYIEAHATSTPLGDATELNAMAEVLRDHIPPTAKIPVGSVKANIGHALEAAGIAGFLKAVLSMQHGLVPPAVNVRTLNPNIDWDQAPFYVPMSPTPWPASADGRPRRAAVNAFGIGGLNMHIVLDEFAESDSRSVAVPSAMPKAVKTAAQIRQEQSVAVIGMGCIFPGAGNVAAFGDLLASGRDPKCQAPSDRWRADLAYRPGATQLYRTPTTLGGFITGFTYDWRSHKIPPRQVAGADPLQFMLLAAADQALKDSGYDTKAFDRARTGVIVGTVSGDDFSARLQMGLRLPQFKRTLAQVLAEQGVHEDQIGEIAEQGSMTVL
ncbi:MAG: hypothetical protein A2V98_18460 [Planctomycetes bacterium RBG_16_64_12]|nr:MAG: hypothetical protein A2V98_18460 [Planctomycetes bacterium RBG_16_64_12]